MAAFPCQKDESGSRGKVPGAAEVGASRDRCFHVCHPRTSSLCSPGADCPAEGQPGYGQRQPISQALRRQADACAAARQRSRQHRCRFRRTRWQLSRAAGTSDPNIGAGLKHDKPTVFKNSTQAEPYEAPWIVTWWCGLWPTTASPAWLKIGQWLTPSPSFSKVN